MSLEVAKDIYFMNILKISKITHVKNLLETFKVGCGIFLNYFSVLQSHCDVCSLMLVC